MGDDTEQGYRTPAEREMADRAALLEASNDDRVATLEKESGSEEGTLANAFDALRMLVFLEQIAAGLGVADIAELDFQGRREEMIEKLEAKFQQMKEARDAAERARRLSGPPTSRRGGVPTVMGPGGILRPGD